MFDKAKATRPQLQTHEVDRLVRMLKSNDLKKIQAARNEMARIRAGRGRSQGGA